MSNVNLVWVTPDAENLLTYIARVSNPANQQKQLESESPEQMNSRLIGYLIKHKHWSPFEMVNACFEITTTRAISAQILRHRSFCLGANTEIWFDLPADKYRPYKKRIEDLYDNFHFGSKPSGINKIRMPMQNRIKAMRIRCLNEETGDITHTHINDITKNKAHLFKVTLESGEVIEASKEHHFFTDMGWLTLEEALNKKAKVTIQTNKSKVERQYTFPQIDEANEIWLPIKSWENYYISNMGRLKRVGKHSQGKIRIGTPSKSNGYPILSLNKPGVQKEYPVHTLVLKTFKPQEDYTNLVARHKNHNKLDNRLDNLEWGSDLDNKMDTYTEGLCKQLTTKFVEIISVEDLGVQDSYDISVDGPWHNFVANNIVVHNSFQEFSQRYSSVAELPEFHYPEIRYAGTTNRQASLTMEDAGISKEDHYTQALIAKTAIDDAMDAYQTLLDKGVAPESARMVLPMCSPTRLYMNGTIRSWIHYLQIRIDEAHVQKEHVEIAKQINNILSNLLPLTWKALNA